ncbi:MAG: hypothetical protein YFSK_1940 [Candidatus Yanofskyibacterium parasiticum]|nr:MAG: hypothetical protein YFSK_1940 [Candidatus Yanofskybacteria bacterium]
MENDQTKGSNIGADDFITAESGATKETKSIDDVGGDAHGLRYIPTLIKSLEDHFSFSVLLLSVIGYIVIAAFGQMNSLWKFFGYLFFLVTLLFFYKYKSLEIRDVIKKINKFFLVSFFLLLLIIIFLLSIYFYKCDLRNILLEIIIFLDRF